MFFMEVKGIKDIQSTFFFSLHIRKIWFLIQLVTWIKLVLNLKKIHPSGRKCGLCASTMDMAMDSSAEVESHSAAASVNGVSCWKRRVAAGEVTRGDKFFHCFKENKWVRRFTFTSHLRNGLAVSQTRISWETASRPLRSCGSVSRTRSRPKVHLAPLLWPCHLCCMFCFPRLLGA